MSSARKSISPVLVATSYPLHADAFRSYLHGFYPVTTIQHTEWNPGLPALRRELMASCPAAVAVDDTFPYDAVEVAECIHAQYPDVGMIFLDAEPNIFRVLHGLDNGFRAYLYPGDDLAGRLRMVIDRVRRGERYLSPSIRGLHERYAMYRGVFGKLPPRLEETFKMMGEGLSATDIQRRVGVDMSVIYRRQYRLRKYFGVETNEELLDIIRLMYEEPIRELPRS